MLEAEQFLNALTGDPDRRVRVAAAETLHSRRRDQLHELLDAVGNPTDWLRSCLRAASSVSKYPPTVVDLVTSGSAEGY